MEEEMRLRNVLIVVKDIEKSKKFYHDLFGLDVILDNDGNVILTEGLVLQDEKIWKDVTGKEVVPENNSSFLFIISLLMTAGHLFYKTNIQQN